MTPCHEGSDYTGFIDNDARREYEDILLSAYERTSPLSSSYRPTENSTVQEDLENIAEFSDDDGYVERHHPLPVSLGGTKKRGWVTVKLSFQAHFRVHQLLIDFTAGEDRRKMHYAFWRTASKNGERLTAEQYAAAKQALRDAGVSDETRANIRAGAVNRKRPPPVSAETRAKLSAALRMRILTDETRAKFCAANQRRKASGWTFSPEARKKMSAASQCRKLTPEQCTAQSARQLGVKRGPYKSSKPCSLSTRAAISASARGRKLTPEQRAALSAAHRTPEAREHHRAAGLRQVHGSRSMRRAMNVAECEAA